MGVPLYLIALAAFTSRESLNQFPLSLLPTDFSTETIGTFLQLHRRHVRVHQLADVGLATLALSLLIGVPAGYAMARYAFRGRDPYQLFLLLHPGAADRRAVGAAGPAVPRRRASTTRRTR